MKDVEILFKSWVWSQMIARRMYTEIETFSFPVIIFVLQFPVSSCKEKERSEVEKNK